MDIRVRAACLLVPLVGSLLATGAAQASAPEPGTEDGGEVAQTGWWSSINEPPPPNPLFPPPPPPAPDVPEGTLPVTVLKGEPQRISAIEFALDGAPGSTVDSVELSLKESTAKSTVNADGAVIMACAVTESFWVGGENNPWKNRPEYDCEAGKAAGVRDAKTGVWSFDLTGIAAEWKAEDFFGSSSVVLVGAAEGEAGEPLNFQVVLDGPEAKGIGLSASTTAPSGSTGSSSAGSGSDAGVAGSGGSDSGSLGGTGSDDMGSSGTDAGGLGDVGTLDGGGLAVDPPADALPDAAASIADEAAGAPAAETPEEFANVSVAQPPWYQGFNKLGLLLVPLSLVLAYLAMLAMGPAAQPTAITTRRGVGQALDRLRTAGAGFASKVGR